MVQRVRMQNVGVMWPLCGGGSRTTRGDRLETGMGVCRSRVRMERRASSCVIRWRALQRCGDGGKTEADLACPDLAPITNRPADELALDESESWRQPCSPCRRRCPRAKASHILAQRRRWAGAAGGVTEGSVTGVQGAEYDWRVRRGAGAWHSRIWATDDDKPESARLPLPSSISIHSPSPLRPPPPARRRRRRPRLFYCIRLVQRPCYSVAYAP